jgi:uncharacterized protein (DUF1778 family)
MAATATALARSPRRARGTRKAAVSKPKAHSAKSKAESLSMRVDPQTRFVIDSAANVLGQTRTEFMLSTARSRAIDIVLSQRLFVLNDTDWGSFVDALDKPMPSNARLKALLGREPIWDRQDK